MPSCNASVVQHEEDGTLAVVQRVMQNESTNRLQQNHGVQATMQQSSLGESQPKSQFEKLCHVQLYTNYDRHCGPSRLPKFKPENLSDARN
jgi:hypothetical protein